MTTIDNQQSAAARTGDDKPKLKLCCACPDTKRPRDECIVRLGDSAPECLLLIDAHKQCLRRAGFAV